MIVVERRGGIPLRDEEVDVFVFSAQGSALGNLDSAKG